MNFRAIGSKTQNYRRTDMMPLSIISASLRANRCQFGGKRDGSILLTRVVGFNGTAGIISDAVSHKKMLGRLGDGKRCAATFGKLRRTANRAICVAGGGSGKRFCNGRTIAGKSNPLLVMRGEDVA